MTLTQLLSHQECPTQSLFLKAVLHSHVGENNQMGEVSHLLMDSFLSIGQTLMDGRSLGLRVAAYSIFPCWATVTPVRQAVWHV